MCLGYLPLKTNADRIRFMSDEELAYFLVDIQYSSKVGTYSDCLDWLKEEVKKQ